jgi:hypothetical protein
VGPEGLGEQIADRSWVEDLADDGGALDRATLFLPEAFEARGEERGDRGRHGDGR